MNILITGTSKGIGLNLVKYYTELGHNVIGCSRTDSAYQNKNYIHYKVDLSKENDIENFAKVVRKDYGFIDVLINNAGIASMNHFVMTPVNTARNLMELNYIAPFTCIRAFLNCLRKSKHPRIINFTTVAVPFNLDGELAYVSSKSAVESMTKVLAKELANFKITINAIGPTPVKTDLIAKISEEKLKELLNRQAIKRFGEFSDIINVIDFFINPNSDFITGQIIYLGGVNR